MALQSNIGIAQGRRLRLETGPRLPRGASFRGYKAQLMKIVTHARCTEYAHPGHPERPARITATVERLKSQTELAIEWLAPVASVEDPTLLRAHLPSVLQRLEAPLDFDMDTPSHADLPEHARRSVAAALQALACAQRREAAFSLMRPPGHHATRSKSMGFCYLNNIAIAALAARAEGAAKVAVFDFDVHHGNGTEDILLEQPGCATFSVHQFPAYPGSGRRHRGSNCHNYLLPPGASREAYRDVASRALEQMAQFKPELLAVSAGFDAYVKDPLCQQQLLADDFHWYGRVFRDMGFPTFSLLEGGYSDDLPELILAYLRGLKGLKLQEPLVPQARAVAEVLAPDADVDHHFWGPSL